MNFFTYYAQTLTYYAQNYASIICQGLSWDIKKVQVFSKYLMSVRQVFTKYLTIDPREQVFTKYLTVDRKSSTPVLDQSS